MIEEKRVRTFSRPDYGNVKITDSFVRDGVKYTLKGDAVMARRLVDEGTKQFKLFEMYNDLPYARRSSFVDSGNGVPAEIVCSVAGGMKSVTITAPGMIVDEVIDTKVIPEIPLYDMYSYPAIAWRLFDETDDFEDVKVWWVAEGLTWNKPMFHRKRREGEDNMPLFWRVHGSDSFGEWSKTFVKLPEIGKHLIEEEYVGDTTINTWNNPWDYPDDEFPGMCALSGCCYGPNLSHTYWKNDGFCVEKCGSGPCPDICKVTQGNTIAAFVDDAGNQVIDYNLSVCGGTFYRVKWRTGYWTDTQTCYCIMNQNLSHVWTELTGGEWTGSIMATREGERNDYVTIKFIDDTGREYKSSMYTQYQAYSAWLEGVYTGVGAASTSCAITGDYNGMLYNEHDWCSDPDTNTGMAGAVVRDAQDHGYEDGAHWIILYFKDIIAEHHEETVPVNCSGNIDFVGFEYGKTLREYWAEIDGDKKFLLWNEYLTWGSSSDAFATQVNIYDFHGEPVYVFGFNKGYPQLNNDSEKLYMALIFRKELKMSDPFDESGGWGWDVHRCVDKWDTKSYGLADLCEIVHEYIGKKPEPVKHRRENRYGNRTHS